MLRGLLDGHPDVFSSPIHEVVPLSFMNEHDGNDWLSSKDTEQLRKLLANPGRYFRIERFANNRSFQIDFSSQHRTYIPFEFDFYGFDREVFYRLNCQNDWTINGIVETIYQTFALFLSNHIASNNSQHFATMGEPYEGYYDSFSTHFPSGKVIYVDRPTENIVATRCGRRPISEDFRSKTSYATDIESLIGRGEVQNIELMRSKQMDLQSRFPRTFKVVTFEELVLNTTEAMVSVAEFIGIDYHPILSKYSFYGKEVTCDGKKYIGQELDRLEDLLSETEIQMVRNLISSHKHATNRTTERFRNLTRFLMRHS